jgi:stalled ribosome alternative rescue factor ArfA
MYYTELQCTYILKEKKGGGSHFRKGGSEKPEQWLSLTGTMAQNALDYSYEKLQP